MQTYNPKQVKVFEDYAEAYEWEKENDKEWENSGYCVATQVPYHWENNVARIELQADLVAHWCHGDLPRSTRDCIIKEWKVVVWKDKNKENEYELRHVDCEQDGNEELERLALKLS